LALRGAGGELRYEECFTREGFEGPYTILYHLRPPHTQRLVQAAHAWELPKSTPARPLAKRHYRTQALPARAGAPLESRVPLLFNEDVVLSVAQPSAPDPVLFADGDADTLLFIREGGGTLLSALGELRFTREDYVIIPRGLPHRLVPEPGAKQNWLCIECLGGLHLPRQWRNETGQLRMDAPYSHRDFRRPEFRGPSDDGLRDMLVKKNGAFHGFRYTDAPFDVVGWDGTVYPFVFPILNFQPRAGLVHLPPTWHGTFATRGALICSFVPRVTDFHPEAVPCPYPHASVDCDEFLYYVRGSFTSRRGVGPGSVSHHPAGVMHGPHPGAYEGSVGSRSTDELAVMLDTYRPLQATAAALEVEDPGYQDSFIPSG
jgi:homogentisate 1,2-dioxygenase